MHSEENNRTWPPVYHGYPISRCPIRSYSSGDMIDRIIKDKNTLHSPRCHSNLGRAFFLKRVFKSGSPNKL